MVFPQLPTAAAVCAVCLLLCNFASPAQSRPIGEMESAAYILERGLSSPASEQAAARFDVEENLAHVRERRSSTDLGDLTAGESGVLNHNYVPLENCKDLYDDGHTTSGIYLLDLHDGDSPFNVFCDMSLDVGGKKGWLAIQRRVDNTVDFDRPRKDYKYGFGKLDGNFWLGLEKIKRIIDSGANGYELYMGMGDYSGTQVTKYANWNTFSLGTEANDWQLTISTTTGYTASTGVTNSLTVSNDKKFTTSDDDNDSNGSGNCASTYKGGWWFNNCHEANPNGFYYTTSDNQGDYNGVLYEGWKGKAYSLKTMVMLIRPK